ncbi:ComF family protein [Polynucleobacter sp. JS-Safj-400b-B2]|nr:ComF family protein [Polynucleobacter sp. JS-Safj-400b-B2]
MRISKNIFQTICAHLLPTACITCQEFQKFSICNECLDSLKDSALCNYQCCYQCGIALQASEVPKQKCVDCEYIEPYFDETYCLDRYEGLLQTPLHELKYQKRIAFAGALSSTWNLLIGQELEDIPADYLLPVPLSIQKLAQRGFNQSWEIAKHIRCGKHIQKSPYVLRRHHYSGHQAGSSLCNRYLAIQGMFYVEPNDIQKLKNKTVIVFDDVMTSGATLNEIARVLKDNGVSRVINWVLLRAARPI